MVTVSRRVYRSGESEYRINGAACRLREVNELFYDTGGMQFRLLLKNVPLEEQEEGDKDPGRRLVQARG